MGALQLAWLLSTHALASGGGHGEDPGAADGSMVLLLTILGAIGSAYLLAHFLVDRLQRRWLFTSGAEYVLLGVLLGSSSGVLSDHSSLAPVLAFGTGWIGLLHGASLRLDKLRALPRWTLRLAGTDLVVVGGGVMLVGWALLELWLGIPTREAILAAGVLGCAATSGSRSSTELLLKRFPQLGPTSEGAEGSDASGAALPEGSVIALVEASARLTQTLGIVAFGVLVCVFHPQMQGVETAPVASEWLLLMLGLGLALGGLFRLLVSSESTENQRFMAMVGIICFSTGAAFFLDLSALTVNLVLGAVLVQGAEGPQLDRTLTSTLGPVVLLLLVLAGVVWTPVSPLQGGVLAVALLASRSLLKVAGGAIAAAGNPVRADIGRGALAQGPVALCIALSYRLIFRGDAVDLVFTAILASVVVSEAIAPRLLKGLLVDAGELRQDVAMQPHRTSA